MTAPGSEPLRAPVPSGTEERYLELELDQLSAGRRVRVPRAQLGRRLAAGLWALRIVCLILSVMVVYTFVHQLV